MRTARPRRRWAGWPATWRRCAATSTGLAGLARRVEELGQLVTRAGRGHHRRDDRTRRGRGGVLAGRRAGPARPERRPRAMLDPARRLGGRGLPALPGRAPARLLAVAPRGRRGTALAAPGVAGRLRRRRPRSPRRRTGTTGNGPASSPGSSPTRTCAGSRTTSPAGYATARPGPRRSLDALPVIAAWWSTERDKPGTGAQRRADHRGQPGSPQRRPAMTRTQARGGRATWTAGLAVALGAGVATAHGLYQVAAASGVPHPVAWLYPLITDGLALVAYAATARLHSTRPPLRRRRRRRRRRPVRARAGGLPRRRHHHASRGAGRVAVRGRRLARGRRRAHRAPAAPDQHRRRPRRGRRGRRCRRRARRPTRRPTGPRSPCGVQLVRPIRPTGRRSTRRPIRLYNRVQPSRVQPRPYNPSPSRSCTTPRPT